MKLLSKLLVCISLLMSCVFVSPSVKAEEYENNLVLEFLSFNMPTEYPESDYETAYYQIDNTYHAEVIEKSSGVVVEHYSETPSIPIELISQGIMPFSINDTTYMTYLEGDVSLGNMSGYPVSAHVVANVQITAGSYYYQFNYLDYCNHWEGSGGYYTLVNRHTSDRTSAYPASSISIQIIGMIQVAKDEAQSIGISYTFLQQLGFEMSGTSTSYWYARKNYNKYITLTY